MSRTERVVITGMGVASPLGCTLNEFWNGLLACRSGVVSLDETIFADMPAKIGGIAQGCEDSEHFKGKEARRMSRSSQLGLVGAEQVISHAHLENGNVNRAEVGVIVGSSIGGYSASDQFFKSFYLQNRLSPFTIPISMNVGPGANISIKHGPSALDTTETTGTSVPAMV